MEADELNKCLAKFYVSVRKTDGSYYKKTNLLSIAAALDLACSLRSWRYCVGARLKFAASYLGYPRPTS